jgi:hypothetical protein
MTGKDNSRTRQAVRRAREARAAREEALAAREEAIEVALVDYFRAAGEADRIREQARARADALLTEATRVASVPWAAACAAVRRLRDLVGNNAQVAELCGLKPEEVRGMLAATRAGEAPTDAGKTARPAESPDELVGEPASVELPGRPQDDPSAAPSSHPIPPPSWRAP